MSRKRKRIKLYVYSTDKGKKLNQLLISKFIKDGSKKEHTLA